MFTEVKKAYLYMVARQANVAVSCQVHCKGIVRGEKVYSLGGGVQERMLMITKS